MKGSELVSDGWATRDRNDARTVAHDNGCQPSDGFLGNADSQIVGEEDAPRDRLRRGVDVLLQQANIIPATIRESLGVSRQMSG